MTSIRRSGICIAILALSISSLGCDDPVPAETGLMPGDTSTIATRSGYKAQCKAWEGDICVEPWIAMNGADIVDPDPHCVDDTTTLRPLWFGDPEEQAEVFCWIATGDSSWVLADEDGASADHGGWQYNSSGSVTDCSTATGFRRYSTVDIPGIGEQLYAFDQMTEVRTGDFSRYQCNW
jgi:hypothetical protein